MLPASIARTLQSRTGNNQLTCVPQDNEYGWFCACGAFHPNEESTSTCSECGGDRAQIKSTLTNILEDARRAAERQQQEINSVAQQAAPQQPVAPKADPAATAAAAQAAINSQLEDDNEATAAYDPKSFAAPQDEDDEEDERVRRYAPKGRLFADEDDEDEGTQMYDTDDLDDDLDDDDEEDYAPRKKRGRYADDDEVSEDDEMAERIIHWAPPITAIVCALIIAVSLVYHFVLA